MRKAMALGAAAAALIAAGTASAQHATQVPERGLYFGGDIGQSWGPSGGDINGSLGTPTTGTSVDEKDTGWGLHLGYRFHRNWAAEFGYRDLGKFDYSAGTATGAVNGEYKAQAWSLAAIGMLPLGSSPFSLYGKLGAARVDVDRTVNSQPAGATASSASNNRTVPLAGIGLNYDISRNMYTRLGWDHYDRVGDGGTGRTDIDLVHLGVGWRF